MNLTELFNTRFFRIPDYQRGYPWEEKRLHVLWDDLVGIPTVDDEFKNTTQQQLSLKKQIRQILKKWLSGAKRCNIIVGQFINKEN